jgi:hypothetical protein
VVAVAPAEEEAAAVPAPAAADSRHKLRPGQPLGRLHRQLGRLPALGPAHRSLVLVPRRVLVPLLQLLVPLHPPLDPAPAMWRQALVPRLAR